MFTQFAESDIKNRRMLEEIRLLERIADGQEKALSQLYDKYSRLIYSLIVKIVKNNEEAEELLQSVFVKIWDKARMFDRTKGNVYSWIVTMARNSAIDRIRSKQYRTKSENNVEIEKADMYNLFPSETGMDAVLMNERLHLINRALKQVPIEQSHVIELAYFEGMSQSEIALHLNIPLGTVKTRMRQALIKLEKILSHVI